MYYIGNIPCVETDIRHYGITGMKWGQRRYQNPDGTLTEAGKLRYTRGGEKREDLNINQLRKKIDKSWDKSQREPIKDVNRELSKKGQTTADLYAMRVAYHLMTLRPISLGIDIADGLGALSASSKAKTYFRNREKNSIIDPKTGLYKKRKEMTEDEDMKVVNPEFKDFNTNTKNNCMLCTTTYDIRRRGFDVTAQKDSEGFNFNDMKRWYPKAKLTTISSESPKSLTYTNMRGNSDLMKRTSETLIKQGNGARGNIIVRFSDNGGSHSMVYEIQDSKLVIRDCQSGRTYKNPNAILSKVSNIGYIRLDNVEPNIENIKKEVVR